MREEEEETTKEVDHKQIVDDANCLRSNGYAQLSLLARMQPVATPTLNGHQNSHLINSHHQNETSNGHARKNGHVQKKSADQKRLIDPPQLEMPILHQVRSNKRRSSKRRRKVYHGPSLFDWLNKNQEK